MRNPSIIGLNTLALGAALLPGIAGAATLLQIVGYFDIFIGIFLTASIIMFAAALIVYFIRYGTAIREEMFPYMQGAITILFVLFVLLALIRFFQHHISAMLYVLGVIVFLIIIRLLVAAAGEKTEKKEGGGH